LIIRQQRRPQDGRQRNDNDNEWDGDDQRARGVAPAAEANDARTEALAGDRLIAMGLRYHPAIDLQEDRHNDKQQHPKR
jgi:hypothetical protein